MNDRIRVRVTMQGGEPHYELILEGVKAADLSWLEVMELGMNCTSSLRFVSGMLSKVSPDFARRRPSD